MSQDELIEILARSLPRNGCRLLEAGDYGAVEINIRRRYTITMWVEIFTVLIGTVVACWLCYSFLSSGNSALAIITFIGLILIEGIGLLIAWRLSRRAMLRDLGVLAQVRSASS